jgi:DNA repair protein RecO (recombination protein O)
MTESAHGIILRTRPLTETSLIVNWLTPQFGRISTVAKGARRPKSSFAGKLDLFYEADFLFARSRKSDLHILREVNLCETNKFLRGDILKLQRAAYAANFIEQATETESPIPAIYHLLREFVKAIETQNAAQIIFAFEWKLLHELGLEPDLTETHLTAGTKKIAEILFQKNFGAIANLKLMKPQVEEFRQFLHGFLIFHLDKLPKGRANALAEEF